MKKVVDLIGYQTIPTGKEISDLKKIILESKGDGVIWLVTKVYAYGVMQGKRQDRSRRKGGYENG